MFGLGGERPEDFDESEKGFHDGLVGDELRNDRGGGGGGRDVELTAFLSKLIARYGLIISGLANISQG